MGGGLGQTLSKNWPKKNKYTEAKVSVTSPTITSRKYNLTDLVNDHPEFKDLEELYKIYTNPEVQRKSELVDEDCWESEGACMLEEDSLYDTLSGDLTIFYLYPSEKGECQITINPKTGKLSLSSFDKTLRDPFSKKFLLDQFKKNYMKPQLDEYDEIDWELPMVKRSIQDKKDKSILDYTDAIVRAIKSSKLK
jgi:hypothetical protein